jgi:hypothetical protein
MTYRYANGRRSRPLLGYLCLFLSIFPSSRQVQSLRWQYKYNAG